MVCNLSRYARNVAHDHNRQQDRYIPAPGHAIVGCIDDGLRKSAAYDHTGVGRVQRLRSSTTCEASSVGGADAPPTRLSLSLVLRPWI
jgi:hypothetical protein